MNLYHIARKVDWIHSTSQREYWTESLETEGFIHCSLARQIPSTANQYFKGVTDELVLLHINSNVVKPQIRFESPVVGNDQFPHIYGPLNLDAVVGVIDFVPDSNGIFHFPEGLPG